MVSLAGILFGILLLICGGTALVHGASQVAARHGVSAMVVGLTVVAFGTSMPELVVNVIGGLRGETGLAFGNIIGSNIANLALILGVAAILRPIQLDGLVVQREVPLLVLGTAVLTVLALDSSFEGHPNAIGRADSLILLLVFCIFAYITAFDIIRSRRQDALMGNIKSNPLIITKPVTGFAGLYVFFGIVLLYVGGEMTVRFSVRLADGFAWSSTQVGLFIVAVGTSMPEMVTSIIAALRRESDLAVGNLVGSNIFNTLLILPVTGFVSVIAIPARGVIDVVFSLALAAALMPIFVLGKARLGRASGVLILTSYAAWVVFRVG